MPVPSSAAASPAAPEAAPADGEALTVATPNLKPTLMHVATAEDLERLDSITLEDLNERLQNLKFNHAGERPTESEFDADLHLFAEAVREGL